MGVMTYFGYRRRTFQGESYDVLIECLSQPRGGGCVAATSFGVFGFFYESVGLAAERRHSLRGAFSVGYDSPRGRFFRQRIGAPFSVQGENRLHSAILKLGHHLQYF